MSADDIYLELDLDCVQDDLDIILDDEIPSEDLSLKRTYSLDSGLTFVKIMLIGVYNILRMKSNLTSKH